MAIGPGNWVYVTDAGNHRIQVFTDLGAFLGTWGSLGSDPGEFHDPRGIAVGEDRVYVADGGNRRIQVFTLVGELLGSWETPGAVYGLALGEGGLWGTGFESSRVHRWSPDGAPLGSWLAESPEAPSPGRLTGIVVGYGGTVFVGRQEEARVAELSPDGVLLSAWGGPGTGAGELGWIFGMASGEGGTLFVADLNGCVHRFTVSAVPVRPSTWGLLKARAR